MLPSRWDGPRILGHLTNSLQLREPTQPRAVWASPARAGPDRPAGRDRLVVPGEARGATRPGPWGADYGLGPWPHGAGQCPAPLLILCRARLQRLRARRRSRRLGRQVRCALGAASSGGCRIRAAHVARSACGTKQRKRPRRSCTPWLACWMAINLRTSA